MGLLDSLTYGSGGGLLDFLRNNALNQQFSSGLPSDQAQYGSPLGSLAQMQPNPAMMQPAQQPPPVIQAQPMQAPQQAPQQYQPQQPPAPQGPGFGDHLMAGLQGFANSGGILPALANGISGLTTGVRSDPAGQAQAQAQQVQNVTKQWLQQRGVDPATINAAIAQPHLLQSLIEQMKPKTPMSLGNGYIYEQDSKKATQVYKPDDKTPNSALEYNFYKENLPKGETPVSYQKWLATKDTDPNKINVLGRGGELWVPGPDGKPVIVHKNEAEQPEATLDDPTVKAMAAQYMAGDKSVMQNLGRGAQGAANIVKLRTEIYHQANDQGLNGKDIVNTFNEQAGNLAGQRSIGTRAANISLAANEANNMIPIALKASDAVPRGEWMPWNKMVQAYQTGSSSPELARFVAATNSLVNSYVRAVSPSGVPTDSMREHAYSMLNSAQSAKAYKAVTDIMQDEMKAAMEAPGQVRKELRHDEKPAEAAKTTGLPDGWSVKVR